MDNNDLSDFPEDCAQLKSLKHLWLRQNKIKEIPLCVADLKDTLLTLSLSSNKIEEVPKVLSELCMLRKLYLNGNRIENVDASLANLDSLDEVTLSNNNISSVPSEWTEKWGAYDLVSGNLMLSKDTKVVVKLFGNHIA